MVSIEDLLEKVVHLEQELGHKAKYPVMAPLAGPFDALPSLQSAAKQIAEFVGLHNFNFTIAVTKQEPNVAGRIHLSDAGKSVSVEIDPAMLITSVR
jgi:hypothetical protein